VLLLLITGRGASRITSQVAPLMLLPVWGSTTFAHYANAVGVCSWMVYLSAGAEKAALKLIPRSRKLTGELVRLVLGISALPLMVGLVSMAFVPSGSAVRLYLAAGSWSIANGLLMVVAGLHRLRGRPHHDAAIFVSLSVAILGITGLAWWLDLSPLQVLLALALVATGLAIGYVLALPPHWLLDRAGRRPTRIVVRSVWLLGVADLLGGLSGAVCYAALALAGRTRESSSLYVAMLVCTGFGALVGYLLRVAQPRMSLRLRGSGSAAGRVRAVGFLRAGIIGGVVLAAALPAAFVLDVPAVPLLVAIVLFEIPIYAAVTYAAYLMENTDGRALALTSSSAAAGLVVCVALAVVLVPPFGAAGALAALALSYAARAAVLRQAVHGRYALA
jgi:hypothetical protein